MPVFAIVRTCFRQLFPCLLLLFLVACGALSPEPSEHAERTSGVPSDPVAGLIGRTSGAQGSLEKMGFSIQVGAFSQVQNAARLERLLDNKGLDTYYFRDSSGLFKVRFGNHPNYAAARLQAEVLQRQGVIGRFFIVIPESYAAARIKHSGQGNLRDELVRTAQKFIGVPYLWGGESQKGFDCSGLTMVCYRINGLNLPRNSRAQYARGVRRERAQLKKGDLVFFATQGGRRVTHVGLYLGQGRFIHAPRTGKKVRVADLSSRYWARVFTGGRSYL